jgi:hypothetical protein
MKHNNRKINACRDLSGAASNFARAGVMLSWSLIALISAPTQAQSRDDYCGDRWPQLLDQSPDRARRGRYVNSIYGYSVLIPLGLQGFARGSAPERGLFIALSAQPRSYLSLDASYDVFYDITAEGVHLRDLNTIRLHDAVSADESRGVQLAGQAGRRFVMRFECRGASEPRVHEEIIAVRNREIYRLDLQTTPDRFERDERRLLALLRSWRWEALH